MKNKILFTIILMYSVVSFCQDIFHQGNNQFNDLRKLLNIKDSTATILEFEKTKYLVFQKKKVCKYILSADKEIVFKEKLKKEKKRSGFTVLDTLRAINPRELNIDKKGNFIMQVQDAADYKLKLFTREEETIYSSNAPEVFIEEKFPFYKKRIAYLGVFKFLKAVFYDKRYEDVKKKDTLYIVLSDAKHRIENKYYVNFSKKSQSTYLLFLPTDVNVEQVQKSFVEKQKQNVIDGDFFQRYGYFASTEALKNKKKLFIIDINQATGRILKNSVRLIPLYFKEE